MKLEDAVRQVTDYTSLIALFTDQLGWDIDPTLTQDEVTFEWTADDLKLSDSSTQKLKDGVIRQLRPPKSSSHWPWGIFFVKFADKTYRTAMRQVLRGLVPRRRRDSNLPAWKHDNLLFICTTDDYERFTFAHFRGEKSQTAKLATFGWQRESVTFARCASTTFRRFDGQKRTDKERSRGSRPGPKHSIKSPSPATSLNASMPQSMRSSQTLKSIRVSSPQKPILAANSCLSD